MEADPENPDRYLKRHCNGNSISARFSIHIDPALIARRITVPLLCHDIDEGRARRDILEDGLRKAMLARNAAGFIGELAEVEDDS